MTHLFYLLVYILTAVIVFVDVNSLSNIKKYNYFLIFGVVLFLLCAFRQDTMPDYDAYAFLYDGKYDITRMEPAFKLIVNTLHGIKADVLWLFIVYAFITISLKLSAIKFFGSNVPLAVLAWLSCYFVMQDMIAIRSAVAAALLYYIIIAKVNGKIFLSLFFVLISFTFHYSSLIFLLVVILSNKKDYRYLYMLSIPISYGLYLSGFHISNYVQFIGASSVDSLYDRFKDDSEMNIFNFLILGRNVLCVAFWLVVDKLKYNNKYNIIALKSYTVGCVLCVLFADLNRVGFRFAELFWSLDIILIPNTYYCFGKKTVFYPLLICSVLFYIMYSTARYWDINL